MKRRNLMVCVLGWLVLTMGLCVSKGFVAPVTPDTAEKVAVDKAWDFIDGKKREPRRVSQVRALTDEDGNTLAHVAELEPEGFIVTSTDTEYYAGHCLF